MGTVLAGLALTAEFIIWTVLADLALITELIIWAVFAVFVVATEVIIWAVLAVFSVATEVITWAVLGVLALAAVPHMGCTQCGCYRSPPFPLPPSSNAVGLHHHTACNTSHRGL